MTKINYVTQLLISRSNTAKNHTMITIDTINANFQNCLARVTGDNGYKDKALEEEAKALIKLAYISIMAKIQEMNTEQMLGTFEEFDKTELKQQVEEEQKNIINYFPTFFISQDICCLISFWPFHILMVIGI